MEAYEIISACLVITRKCYVIIEFILYEKCWHKDNKIWKYFKVNDRHEQFDILTLVRDDCSVDIGNWAWLYRYEIEWLVVYCIIDWDHNSWFMLRNVLLKFLSLMHLKATCAEHDLFKT